MVAVNVMPGAGLARWREYWREAGGGTAVLYAQDSRREAVRALGIRSPGATVVLDRRGRVIFRDASATGYDALKRAVTEAL